MEQIASIIILGILAQWIAWYIKVPAILPLILTGLFVGPFSPYWHGGEYWLTPIYDETKDIGLFPNETLFYFVSLAIGVILFEGGLTLKRKEIKGVAPTILKLISVGSVITFIGAGLAAHFVLDLNWSISFLFAALIIVTGPTVIAPILQNVPLNKNISTVLKWEGILIDPIGALASVLVYEFIVSGQDGVAFSFHAFKDFLVIVLVGGALGVLSALLLRYLLKNDRIPHFLLNVFALAYVLAVFTLSDALAYESGLLTVVVMGMVLGNLDVPNINEILYFKESLSVLLISILFILLAANIKIEDLQLLMNWQCLLLFSMVVFILRPLGVFVSTNKSNLDFKEKLFISWVGPRGIVAAGIASLFGLKLSGSVEDAEYLTPLVFMIVLGTVLLNATTAKPVAKMLKVIQEASNGILIVGANKAAIVIAKYLQENGRNVVLIDNSIFNVKMANEEGVEALQTNIYTDTLEDNIQLVDMGYMMAMTSNNQVNTYAIRKYQKTFGEKGAFRLLSHDEMKGEYVDIPEDGILSYTDDFLNINEAARDFPHMNELEFEGKESFEQRLEELRARKRSIPVFIKNDTGRLDFLPKDTEGFDFEGYSKLVYLGQTV